MVDPSKALVRLVTEFPSTIPVLTGEIVEALPEKHARAVAIRQAAQAFVISSEEEAQKAAGYLTRVHAELQEVEADRLAFSDPLTKLKKAWDAGFKPRKNELEIAKGALSLALGKYRQAEQAAKAKLLEASNASEETTPEERRALVVAATEDAPKLAGLRESITWEITGIDEALVPREFFSVDVAKIAARIKATEGTVQLPGVSFSRVVKLVPTGR